MTTNPRSEGSAKPAFLVFSLGNARKPSTWSNVPYFFTRTLERMGYPVQRVNIAPARIVQLLFDVPWKIICRLTGSRTRFSYLRSGHNRRVTDARIANALRRYPDRQCVFMTYSFGPSGQQLPYTLFCDQTFAQHITYFDERSPDILEKPTIKAERKNLRDASLVIALFPEVAEELQRQHGRKVKYYGNVVNIDRSPLDASAMLARKEAGMEIVFIGKSKYKEGLEWLAKAVHILNAGMMPGITVNVIGMRRRDLPSAPANMVFHGYLDKGDPKEYRTYLDILQRSRLFVNPNPKWAAFSASSEALYLHTPVVIFPYPEFERTFGDVDRVGLALRSEDPRSIAEGITVLLRDKKLWHEKALAAHEAANDMTWDAFVKRWLKDVETI